MTIFMLVIIAASAYAGQTLGQKETRTHGPSQMVISTSETVDLARTVGQDQGINVEDRRHVTINILLTQDGKPFLPGYITLGIYHDIDLLAEVSINMETGQLVDSEKCAVYEYPNVTYLQRRYTTTTGAKPLTVSELSAGIGCEALKELKIPILVRSRH